MVKITSGPGLNCTEDIVEEKEVVEEEEGELVSEAGVVVDGAYLAQVMFDSSRMRSILQFSTEMYTSSSSRRRLLLRAVELSPFTTI